MSEKITGQGRLKVGESVMDISFSVPPGLCNAREVLPDVQRFADQVTALATARIEAAGLQISCTMGCGACCRQMVPVSPVEARHLAELVNGMPPERAAAVRTRFDAARARLADAGVVPSGHPDTNKPAFRQFGLAYFRAGVPCPFLENESCSIHPARPLVCREYLVTSPAAACAGVGSGQVRKVAMPVRVWNVFARSVSPDGAAEWMPLTESLAFAQSHPESAPRRTGPQHIDAFLSALRNSSDEPPHA